MSRGTPTTPKRIGIVSSSFARPLFAGLYERENGDNPFSVEEDNVVQLAEKLRQGKLDGAFLSPAEYAMGPRTHEIVPGVGVLAKGESRSVVLFCRQNLRNISVIDIDPRFPSEILLASLVLAEKFDTQPQFRVAKNRAPGSIPAPGSDTQPSSDAILLVDKPGENVEGHPIAIDIVDEWFDITEVPYVHGFWAVRETALSERELSALKSACRADGPGIDHAHFSYDLDDEGMVALGEFYRMAFYHGRLGEVPEVRLVG